MKFVQPDPAALSRRQLLKTGFLGSIFLSTVSLTAGLSGCSTTPSSRPAAADKPTYRFLSDDDIALWSALAPVILSNSLPQDPVQREQETAAVIQRIDTTLYFFGPAKQQEIRQLFDLLNLGLTRSLVAGVWSSWPNASAQSIDDFLESWRSSSLGVLNQGYAALTQIAAASFYSAPSQWARANYPGPQAWAVDALPQFKHG